MAFAKEITAELIRQEIERVEEEITQLRPLQTDVTTVNFQLFCKSCSCAAGVLWRSSAAVRDSVQLAAHEHGAAQAALPLSCCGRALPAPPRDDERRGGGGNQQTRAAVPPATHAERHVIAHSLRSSELLTGSERPASQQSRPTATPGLAHQPVRPTPGNAETAG